MEGEVFDDLRQFIERAKKVTDCKEIKGASWYLEISTLIEATAPDGSSFGAVGEGSGELARSSR